MKKLLFLIVFHCTFFPNINAITTPTPKTIDQKYIAKLLSLSPLEVQRLTGHKMNFIEKLEWKILQKKFRKTLSRAEDKNSKDTIANIALISGILGFVLLFFVPAAGLLLITLAIITGIIGVNKNKDPKSSKKALIGLIAGLAGVLLLLIAVIAFATGGFF